MSYELDGWDYHAYQMKVERARDKHAAISEFGLTKNEITKHEDYLERNKDNIVQTFAPKTMSFIETWQYIVDSNFAIYNNRGKNKIMCCLQFGGNLEFFESFPNEKAIDAYFQECYRFALNLVGYKQTDRNIVCAYVIYEGNRRNLWVWFVPITTRWQKRIYSNQVSEKGNKKILRDEYDEPIYVMEENANAPLLSRSEFWAQHGGLVSFSWLQESFWQKVSKKYGAKRGESSSYFYNTCGEQAKRYFRHAGDDIDDDNDDKHFYVDDAPY
ncbi:MAG: hypothetical protein IJ506_01930 [Clostridia bacterium]|nr:hypothetical protein [Clostridia bacterium]